MTLIILDLRALDSALRPLLAVVVVLAAKMEPAFAMRDFQGPTAVPHCAALIFLLSTLPLIKGRYFFH